MNYRQKNNFNLVKNNNKTTNKKSVLFVVLLLLFVVVIFSKWLFFSTGNHFWSFKNFVNSFISYNAEILKSKNALIEENAKLKEQLLLDKNEKIVTGLIKKENEELKNILNRSSDLENIILSNVLVKPFLSAYDTLIIDVGSNDGVKIKDKVIADGNVHIGYISEVYKNTSKVVLYSSSGEKTLVLVGDNNVEKEALGVGSGNFVLEVPRELDIKENDIIILPLISHNIFGLVEKIEFKTTDVFQRILFKSPVNISELKWVQVILEK
jgi:cell shape-determining protein MreC